MVNNPEPKRRAVIPIGLALLTLSLLTLPITLQKEKRESIIPITENDHSQFAAAIASKQRKQQQAIQNLQMELAESKQTLSNYKAQLFKRRHTPHLATIANLQQQLSEKEKETERLREQLQRCRVEHKQESESYLPIAHALNALNSLLSLDTEYFNQAATSKRELKMQIEETVALQEKLYEQRQLVANQRTLLQTYQDPPYQQLQTGVLEMAWAFEWDTFIQNRQNQTVAHVKEELKKQEECAKALAAQLSSQEVAHQQEIAFFDEQLRQQEASHQQAIALLEEQIAGLSQESLELCDSLLDLLSNSKEEKIDE